MTPLHFDIHAAGVLAPGLSSLADLRAVSAGERPHVPVPPQVPSPAMLPAQERRRASPAVRLVLACIDQALRDWPLPAEALHSVFATDEGTGDVCQQMLGALATTRQVSPLLFSNSVLNAPSGYFSIAWRNRQPSSVVSLGLESFASGLLCAVCDAHGSGQPMLLVAYDPPMTPPLDELFPVREGTASAWIISAGPLPGAPPALASFTLAMLEECGSQASAMPAWMPPAWQAHSSARGLAALALVGQESGAEFRLQLGCGLLALRRTAAGGA
ncbi:MAG: hypothetical protein JWQ33_87 [Ramlibacter sp.]|nr:hypothetical protein [Ramlibacter sp.]